MKVVHFTERSLSSKAGDLIAFDMDSIRQVVAAGHGSQPALWLADPDQYELNGRILRDSPSPRLLAYAPADRTLYVTDGCNSCAHRLADDLKSLGPEKRSTLANENHIRPELLERLARE